jgi:hypothetical protein
MPPRFTRKQRRALTRAQTATPVPPAAAALLVERLQVLDQYDRVAAATHEQAAAFCLGVIHRTYDGEGNLIGVPLPVRA